MNNYGDGAVRIAVREQLTQVGGVAVAKKTVVATTPEGGMVAYEIQAVHGAPAGNPMQQRANIVYPQQMQLQQAPSRVVISENEPPERNCSYYCFACLSGYEWYDPRGKGICWAFLLVLLWLIVGVVVFALVIVYWVLKCITCNSDD
ncbi:uncharacterized protein [Montipora foliosa]|uniref:uncharacterized protein n=1 Tax=Montipora foliosa TaxID=591990 RepID=UPI0035F138E0